MRRLAAVLFLMCATRVAAATTVSLTLESAPASGEVCRFAARDRENPFRRWLPSNDVTCAAAGSLTFPPGLWNVFARGEGTLSDVTLIDGATAPETLTLPLAHAATLTPLLPAERRGVVYATRSGNAFPVVAGAANIVPAGEPLWLIVLDQAKPVAVLTIPEIEAGAQRSIDVRSGASGALMTWISVPESERDALKSARNIGAPQVRLKGGGDGEPLSSLEALHGAFALIRGVVAGDAELELAGRGWLPYSRRVKIGAQPITVVEEPLLARGAATVVVNWSANDDVPSLNEELRTCEKETKPPQFDITLLACPTPRQPNERVESAACQVIRHETAPARPLYGSFSLEGVPPATYRVELKFGNLPPVANSVVAAPLQIRSVRLVAGYNDIYGDVTFGGKPLARDATIEFAGNGTGFASQEKSEYVAVLRRGIELDAIVNVATCDGRLRAFVLADRPAPRVQRFDIDIPDNELTISVSDTFTQQAITGATVRYVVMSKLVPRHPVLTRVVTPQKEESESVVVLRSLPERELRLTVSAPGYQKQELEPFSMTKSDHKRIDVKLMPLRGTRGKITSPIAFDNAAILWFSPDGAETERAEVSSDGTFVFARAHRPDETIAVVSQSHPLWVLRSPEVERNGTIALQFPNAAPRQFEVVLRNANERENRYVAIVVGRLRIPMPALQQHTSLRRAQMLLGTARPLLITDIAQTGPIEIILGPPANEVLGRWLGTDFFALPQFADAPRKPLPPDAESVFFDLP